MSSNLYFLQEFINLYIYIYIYLGDCIGKSQFLIRNDNFEIQPLLGLAVALKLQMCHIKNCFFICFYLSIFR